LGRSILVGAGAPNGHVRPGLGGGPSHAEADAAVAAGNECNLAAKIEGFVHGGSPPGAGTAPDSARGLLAPASANRPRTMRWGGEPGSPPQHMVLRQTRKNKAYSLCAMRSFLVAK